MALINGTAGSDSLRGSIENDLIQGYQGNDYIFGLGGRDTLYGGTGNDSLYSSTKEDFDDRDDLILGGQGDDEIIASAGNDTLFGGTGNDYLGGWSGNDFLSGGTGDDVLYGVNSFQDQPGSGEIDTLIGGQGQDYFHLGHPAVLSENLPARTYYTQAGNNDFALIVDFDPNSDYIFLNRNDTYNLVDINLPTFGSGVGVMLTTNSQNELIGFLPGFTSKQLVVSRDFLFG